MGSKLYANEVFSVGIVAKLFPAWQTDPVLYFQPRVFVVSKCFKIEVFESPDVLITKAKVAADKKGINFNGDSGSGAFSGQGIEGEYQMVDNKVAVTIYKKPMILPWLAVEASLKNFFV